MKKLTNNKFTSKIFIFFIFFIGIFLHSYNLAEAKTEIFFNPTKGQYYTGDQIVVDLKISTDRSINVIDGTILYNKDKLSVKSVNKDASIFTLWTALPNFDNKKGELNFVGGVPNGFVGENGEILQIIFVAKSDGDAKLDFQDIFSAFANDGLGTSINPWLKTATFSVVKKPISLIFQGEIEFLKNTVKKPSNIAIILIFVLLIALILVIILRRSKKVA